MMRILEQTKPRQSSSHLRTASIVLLVFIEILLMIQVASICLLRMNGLILSKYTGWSFAEFTYLTLLLALAFALLVYAALPTAAEFPRVFFIASLSVALPGMLVALVVFYFRMIFSPSDWKAASTIAHLAADLLPFVLTLSVSIMMRQAARNAGARPEFQLRRQRFTQVGTALLISAATVGLAAAIPRLVFGINPSNFS